MLYAIWLNPKLAGLEKFTHYCVKFDLLIHQQQVVGGVVDQLEGGVVGATEVAVQVPHHHRQVEALVVGESVKHLSFMSTAAPLD